MKKLLFVGILLSMFSYTFAMANPTSVNCQEKGGELKIEKIGNGGEIGVCYFEDNLQCEEWAMFSGKCPVGGIKVTGYISKASRYCALIGGKFEAKQTEENADYSDESGYCTLPNGNKVDVWDLYNGVVSENSTGVSCPVIEDIQCSEGFEKKIIVDSFGCQQLSCESKVLTGDNDCPIMTDIICAEGYNSKEIIVKGCKKLICSQLTGELVGNDKDEHGCIGTAGYSWDEVLGKCIRVWEIGNELTSKQISQVDQLFDNYLKKNLPLSNQKISTKLEKLVKGISLKLNEFTNKSSKKEKTLYKLLSYLKYVIMKNENYKN